LVAPHEAAAVLETGSGGVELSVERVEVKPGFALAKFQGFDSPEQARKLCGMTVVVPRVEAAPLAPGEYYIEDLKGLAVVSVDGRVGEIADVVEGGGGMLAEVRLPDGAARLVPFRNEFFGAVDLEAGTIELLESWILE
jgi:16S rRNA processing protein RimM